jgi:FixJ family two-component response regulator
MIHLPDKPLIACTTTEVEFCDQIAKFAYDIGTDFWTSSDLGLTIDECENRNNSCIIVDYENADGWRAPESSSRRWDTCSILVVIPSGDVRAAFESANLGAVNVIEKPWGAEDLRVNLKVALASGMRLQDLRKNHGSRYSSSVFDQLTKREKKILGLLMEGEPNKRVAAVLDIGLRTVEAERAQIMKKLHVDSFVDLIGFVTRVESSESEIRKEIFRRLLAKELAAVR